MRRLGLGFSLLGVLCLTWPAVPAVAFEGVVKWRLVRVERPALTKVAGADASAETVFAIPYDTLLGMHGDATVSDVTLYAKGDKVRAEGTARADQTYTLTDLATGITQIVAPSEKKVTEFSEQDAQMLQRRTASMRTLFAEKGKPGQGEDPRDTVARVMKGESGEPPPKLELVSLDKEQTISGMPTRGFEVRGGKDPVLGWVTTQHPEVLELLRQIERVRARQSAAAAAARPKTMLTKEGLPVRVQMLDKRAYTVEDLVQIEEKPIDDALLRIPPGFAKLTAAEQANQAGQLKQPKPAGQPKQPGPPKQAKKP